jgi:hypothetical protein
MLSFCDNKYFPSSWKDDSLGYLSMDLGMRLGYDEILGMSTTSIDFDVASVEG